MQEPFVADSEVAARGRRAGFLLARLGLLAGLAATFAATLGAHPGPAHQHPVDLTFSSVPGIPRQVVPSLAQDRSGLLWVGTGDGLAQFDGYRLQSVERDSTDPLQRNMGWVRTMLATPDGRLWIGTEAAGLAVHDPDTRRIQTLGGDNEGAQDGIVALAQDGEGRIWMGTLGGGVSHFDERSARFERVSLPGQPTGEGQGLALASAADGGVWIGHWQGLARWRPGASTLEAVPLPAKPDGSAPAPVTALFASAEGDVWLGTQNGDVARSADGKTWVWLPGAFRGVVRSLAADDRGRLWAGHSAGLDLLDRRDGRLLQRIVHRPGQPAGLAGNEITRVMRDQAGAMWVAGFGVGLQRHQNHPAIAIRGPDDDANGPLRDADVRALLQRRDGSVLAATHAGSVAVLDTELQVLGALIDQGPPVDAMAEDGAGHLWLASRSRVEKRDAGGRLVEAWEPGAGRVYAIRFDAEGGVWVGAERGFLRKGRGDDGFQFVTDADGRALEREVFAVIDDGEGGFLVGGRAGLHQLPAGGDVLRRIDAAPGHALKFPLVLGLLRDRRGTLWVDTPVAGLHRATGRDAEGRLRFENISARLGIIGRPFGLNLHEDGRGRIWSQAFVYDPDTDRIDELRPADGVQFGTPWFHSHTRLANGRLLFAGSRGLMRVDPERFDPSSAHPPLVFTSFRLDGLPYQPRSMAEGLVLAPGTRSFGVEFAALEYADPFRVAYRYRLEGFDPDWIPTDANFRSPSYSQLPPGQYQLQVQAANRAGQWGPTTLALRVVVLPHWWEQRGMRLLFVVAGLAGLLLLVRWRTARLRRRQNQLEQLVHARTEALRVASHTDPLTGLDNRRRLTNVIEGELAMARQWHAEHRGDGNRDLLVFLIDLDHFKAINDTHGHAVGDAVLKRTADALRRVFRESDLVVRWGGEEFLVVARHADRHRANEVAERLRAELARPVGDSDSAALPAVTASFGFVAFPPDVRQPDGWDWDGVLQLADAALYAAKAGGRDAWVGVVDCPAALARKGSAADALRHADAVTQRSA